MQDTTIPSISINSESDIRITLSDTQAQLQDQGYTYNQSGFSYNQVGVDYGGIYNFGQDITPILLNALQITPPIANFIDRYQTRRLQAGQALGPGFFLYLTYPSDIYNP